MIASILGWLGGIKGKLIAFAAAAAAFLLAIFAIYRKGETAGAQSVEIKAERANQKAVQTAQQVDRAVDKQTDEAVQKTLEDKWGRP